MAETLRILKICNKESDTVLIREMIGDTGLTTEITWLNDGEKAILDECIRTIRQPAINKPRIKNPQIKVPDELFIYERSDEHVRPVPENTI